MPKKVSGWTLTNQQFLNFLLVDLYNYLDAIKTEIKRLTNTYNLKMQDIKFANMMFDEIMKLIRVLDTDYYIKSFLSKQETMDFNMNNLNKAFIVRSVKLDIFSQIKNDNIRHVIIMMGEKQADFQDLIYTIIEEVSKYNLPINTLADVQEYSYILK